MKWFHIVRALLDIATWLIRESEKREGAEAARAALGAEYREAVDALIKKAEAARAGVPDVSNERVRDDDGFRRD